MNNDMNDDFLQRLRAPPSKKFLSTLKANLDRQVMNQAKARRTLFRTAILAALIGGSAVAVAFAVLKSTPASSRLVHVATTGPAQSASNVIARSGGGAPKTGGSGSAPPASVTPGIAAVPAASAGQQSRRTFVVAGPTAIILNAQDVAGRWGGPNKLLDFNLTSSTEALAMLCHANRGASAAGFADIAGASRRILASELETCKTNGVTHVAELRSGYEAVVLARSKLYGAPKLSARDIFLALAAEVPDPNRQQTLIRNPYRSWSAVDGALLEERIEVLGPPLSSATAAAFRQTLMEAGCATFSWLAALKQTDSKRYETVCRTLRDDGVYRDKGEKLQEHLETYPNSLALLDFREVAAMPDTFAAATVDGVAPGIDTITAETYAGSRAMFMYVNVERARTSSLLFFVATYRNSMAQSWSIPTLVAPQRQADVGAYMAPLQEMKF
ncbi:MAG TPA: substrate-binding domain-containing protein [Steroidobacteraceae bacterium]|jgi:phosphate transport system substrate-binding protein